MASPNQKLKLLYLAKLFYEETDEDHGLTMPQLIEALAEQDINAERKALYRDIEALQRFGLAIERLRTSPVEYALVDREFSQTELRLLIDAVQSSRFLTKGKSDALVRSLKHLGSKAQMKGISRNLHVEGRIKMQNESVFYNVDAIQRAIAAKRKISFLYFKYDTSKKRALQHGGNRYVATPVQLIYSDGYYYLITYSDKYDDLANYRVDRMMDIEVLEERASRSEKVSSFDVTEYESRVFGMFTGESVGVSLLVEEAAMGPVIDRFGKDVLVTPAGEGRARVSATVMETPTFYGWLAQFGSQIVIEKPKSVADGYQAYLASILAAYEK